MVDLCKLMKMLFFCYIDVNFEILQPFFSFHCTTAFFIDLRHILFTYDKHINCIDDSQLHFVYDDHKQ